MAQLSTRVLALICGLGPILFAIVLGQQSGAPADSLLGVWVHSSSYAVSFVVLGFAGSFGFPLLAGAVAGDLFASEDRYGTWNTLLARSRTRAEVFMGKTLAACVLALALIALATLSSLVGGLIVTGDKPLVGLSGSVLTSGDALWLTLASWIVSAPAALAFTSLAILFSAATRNAIMGVLGPVLVALIMQLLAMVGTGSWVHMLLAASAFDDWHGLLTVPKFYAPLIIGTLVCLIWISACLWVAWSILRNRDFAGPPVTRRQGWKPALRTVLLSASVIAIVALASNLGPAAITKARLESSIQPAFNDLTGLQQEQLGRSVPEGSALHLRTRCSRRSGKTTGPGDDWSCTITVISPGSSANPFQLTPVTYDVGVKADGCYKAQAPPSFIGQQMMQDAHGHSVVNPLFTIYGCFDTTSSSCIRGTLCAETAARTRVSSPQAGARPAREHAGNSKRAPTPGVTAPSRQSEAAQQALKAAERKLGPARLREITEEERKILKEERP